MSSLANSEEIFTSPKISRSRGLRYVDAQYVKMGGIERVVPPSSSTLVKTSISLFSLDASVTGEALAAPARSSDVMDSPPFRNSTSRERVHQEPCAGHRP